MHMVPAVANINVIFRSFPKSQKKFPGVFGVVANKYDIGNCPRCTWCPGRQILTSSSGVFLKVEETSFEKTFFGGFWGRCSQIWHRQLSQVYLVPGMANINVIFRSFPLSRKEIDRKNFCRGFCWFADHKYNIGNCLRCTWGSGWQISTSSPGVLLKIEEKSFEKFFWGFSESLLTNMTSAPVLDSPGAWGGIY